MDASNRDAGRRYIGTRTHGGRGGAGLQAAAGEDMRFAVRVEACLRNIRTRYDTGCPAQGMAVCKRAGAAAGLVVVVASLTGCIAPDVEVIGALGVTVDEEQRPVVVVEACEGTATEVDLFFERESMTGDRENEQVAAWISDSPVPGTSELVLHAPAGPWVGESVEVIVDQGYIATAVGEGDRDVLSQVAFRGEDLVDMEPGTVYINDINPDVRELVGRSAEDFTADVCSRG